MAMSLDIYFFIVFQPARAKWAIQRDNMAKSPDADPYKVSAFLSLGLGLNNFASKRRFHCRAAKINQFRGVRRLRNGPFSVAKNKKQQHGIRVWRFRLLKRTKKKRVVNRPITIEATESEWWRSARCFFHFVVVVVRVAFYCIIFFFGCPTRDAPRTPKFNRTARHCAAETQSEKKKKKQKPKPKKKKNVAPSFAWDWKVICIQRRGQGRLIRWTAPPDVPRTANHPRATDITKKNTKKKNSNEAIDKTIVSFYVDTCDRPWPHIYEPTVTIMNHWFSDVDRGFYYYLIRPRQIGKISTLDDGAEKKNNEGSPPRRPSSKSNPIRNTTGTRSPETTTSSTAATAQLSIDRLPKTAR